METRARYLLVGLLTLATIVGGFLFIYWLNTAGGFGQRTLYHVRFDTPVPGLVQGSPILFNGLRVGDLVDMRLDPSRPHRTVTTIAVDARTPVRADTKVTLSYQGLTGVASIVLEGGAPDAPPLPSRAGEPPLLVAGAAASQDTMTAARTALQSFNQILTDNAAPLKNAIANISTFSDALARNSERFDRIAAGLEQTFGAREEIARADYSLSPPDTYPPIAQVPPGNLVVEQPTALIVFDTQRILVRSGSAITPQFEDGRWIDTIPLLVQSTMVRAFENAGYPRATAPVDALATYDQLLIDIRDFTVTVGPQATAQVELAAKIIDEEGGMAGAESFRASAPVAADTAAAAVAALDEAFRQVAAKMVTWTLGVI